MALFSVSNLLDILGFCTLTISVGSILPTVTITPDKNSFCLDGRGILTRYFPSPQLSLFPIFSLLCHCHHQSEISIYVYNRRLLRDVRMLDELPQLALPQPVPGVLKELPLPVQALADPSRLLFPEIDMPVLEPMAVQPLLRLLSHNFKFFEMIPRELLTDVKRQINGVSAAARNLQIHRQRLEDDLGKFRTTATGFLANYREFESMFVWGSEAGVCCCVVFWLNLFLFSPLPFQRTGAPHHPHAAQN